MESGKFDETLAYIHHVKWQGSRPGLSRTRALLSVIGDPQAGLKFIHIAGTNGKGSTAAMLASILQSAGCRTGLYTSPAINRFNERMQVDGVPISDEELSEITAFIRPYADAMEDHPTEFELVTAIGFAYFARHACDIVVLEVGMGGELDSTNVIAAPALAVITNMGLDHVRELGPTMADIARAKAGIIKPGGTVVIYGQNEEADAVFASVCRERGARLILTDHGKVTNVRPALTGLTFDYGTETNLFCALIGSYQLHNVAVALTAVDALIEQGWSIPPAAVRSGLSGVRWPARFEILGHHPLFIADGGHNPQGIEAAIASIRLHLPAQKPVILLGIMADKDVPHMIEALGPVASQFFTVTPNNRRAMPASELAARICATGCPATACGSIEQGVAQAIEAAGKQGVVVALGSLYLLGDVRSILANRET